MPISNILSPLFRGAGNKATSQANTDTEPKLPPEIIGAIVQHAEDPNLALTSRRFDYEESYRHRQIVKDLQGSPVLGPMITSIKDKTPDIKAISILEKLNDHLKLQLTPEQFEEANEFQLSSAGFEKASELVQKNRDEASRVLWSKLKPDFVSFGITAPTRLKEFRALMAEGFRSYTEHKTLLDRAGGFRRNPTYPGYQTLSRVGLLCETTDLLNLRSSSLKVLPPELKYLLCLSYLDLTDNQLQDISPLKELKNLDDVFLKNNQIQDVSSLENYNCIRSITGNPIPWSQWCEVNPKIIGRVKGATIVGVLTGVIIASFVSLRKKPL